MTSYTDTEIASQPELWRRAAELGPASALPRKGERVAVVGCGTSWFVAQSYAAYRELAGAGETDAFAASEWPAGRRYDRVLAISRSGTTTEIVDLLASTPNTSLITAVPDAPAAALASDVVSLDFADERSVVQTRFPTTVLCLLRAHLGEDLEGAIEDCVRVLEEPLPEFNATQFTFLGRGPSVGLAHEAALKLRETSQSWAESYPAMEYRHGPISIADARTLVWMLGAAPKGLGDQVAATGARWADFGGDPLADLVRLQRVAVALARSRGLDPDAPRNLTRSVVLSA
ncbi:MAG: sugar isomerase [Solirubrobacterales bacterium]|nr:sugar isomerase [Solirubrobacterales bacterium]